MTTDWDDDDVLRDEDWRAPLREDDRRTAADVPEEWLNDDESSSEDEEANDAHGDWLRRSHEGSAFSQAGRNAAAVRRRKNVF